MGLVRMGKAAVFCQMHSNFSFLKIQIQNFYLFKLLDVLNADALELE